MTATPASPRPFDPNLLNGKGGLAAKLIRFLVDHPYWLYAILRRVKPIVTVKDWAFVTRYDDVAEVLREHQAFGVPFGPKIETLNWGPNFLLGMADGPDYRALRDKVAKVFPQEELATTVAPIAARVAEEMVAERAGRLDGIQDLVTHVPTRVCEEYYGITVPDRVLFGQWTIAMSTYMFGDPGDNPDTAKAALAAGDHLRPVIDDSLAKAKAGGSPGTIAERLAQDPEVPHEQARAILIGMITGFVPTNTMAAGHMLEMLLRRPDFLAAAQTAARADDDAALNRALFEAFRFKPLNPGPFRNCIADHVIAAGTPRATPIKAGTKLLAGTQSAMMDPRRVPHPKRFDPQRSSNDYMLFGFGLHWCIGARLAEAQITQTFKALLKRRNLRREAGAAGRMQRLGPFPACLWVRYDAD
jgi:cytochrome P450